TPAPVGDKAVGDHPRLIGGGPRFGEDIGDLVAPLAAAVLRHRGHHAPQLVATLHAHHAGDVEHPVRSEQPNPGIRLVAVDGVDVAGEQVGNIEAVLEAEGHGNTPYGCWCHGFGGARHHYIE